MQNNLPSICKTTAAFIGGLIAYLEPTIHYALICLFAILLDCFTAWQLERRARKNRKIKEKAYFMSKKMSKIFSTMIQIFGVIMLAFLLDRFIFADSGLYLAKIVSGVFCMCQLWSILENVSSENNARWAKILQKIMVNKVSRHLDVDITERELQDETDNKA